MTMLNGHIVELEQRIKRLQRIVRKMAENQSASTPDYLDEEEWVEVRRAVSESIGLVT